MYKKLFFLISLVFVLGLAGSTLAEPNLIAHYVFEGDFNDTSGFFAPQPVGEPCGGFGVAQIAYDAELDSNVVVLDGYDDYVDANDILLNALTNNITIACWVKDTGSNWSTGIVTNGFSWRLYCQANTDIGLQINGLEDSGNTPIPYINGTLGRLDGNWHHAAGVFDHNSLTMSLYVDGIPDGSVTADHTGANFNLPNTYYSVWIGAQEDPKKEDKRWFDGLVDDVRIYNRALSHLEIRMLTGMDLGIAFAPTPFDPETNVGASEILTWYPGMWAATHDVYFGTDYNDVNEATTSDTRGVLLSQGQTDPNYNPHVSDLPYGVFEPDTTYYWRVDEVNVSHPNTPWKGDIWRFTSTDGAASSPSPGDGAVDVTVGSTLSWTAGDYAKL
ncbi:MAG: LamG domain-containing protein, partial [Planctomycetota bacterium]